MRVIFLITDEINEKWKEFLWLGRNAYLKSDRKDLVHKKWTRYPLNPNLLSNTLVIRVGTTYSKEVKPILFSSTKRLNNHLT